MKYIKALIIITILLLSEYAYSECLSYKMSRVDLYGKIEQRTYPGPPNYENITTGDTPETGYYLILDNPICINGDANSLDNYPQSDVRVVQLIFDRTNDKKIQEYLNTKISVSGKLFGAHTGHHHAPLLMQHAELK